MCVILPILDFIKPPIDLKYYYEIPVKESKFYVRINNPITVNPSTLGKPEMFLPECFVNEIQKVFRNLFCPVSIREDNGLSEKIQLGMSNSSFYKMIENAKQTLPENVNSDLSEDQANILKHYHQLSQISNDVFNEEKKKSERQTIPKNKHKKRRKSSPRKWTLHLSTQFIEDCDKLPEEEVRMKYGLLATSSFENRKKQAAKQIAVNMNKSSKGETV
jgi:hypothetical protein